MAMYRVAGWVVLALVCVSASLEARPTSRVILVSFDGAAFWMISKLLEEQKLPNFQRFVEEGAWSEGMISSFPSKTASGFAMIFTGHYGHTSGITGNSLLEMPASQYTRLEWRSGFRSDSLLVDPLWVYTARAGLKTYNLHAQQSYPFRTFRSLIRGEDPKLQILYGYTDEVLHAEVFDARSAPPSAPSGWNIPEARGSEALEIELTVGEERFHGLLFDDPFDSTTGCDTLGLLKDKSQHQFLARVKPGEREPFSAPIKTSQDGKSLWFSLRLFELDPTAARFLLFRSSVREVVFSSPSFPGSSNVSMKSFASNGGDRLYRYGGLGPTIPDGGTGQAEQRLLETIEHVMRQFEEQAEWVLNEGDYALLLLYTPVLDDIAHLLTGYLDPVLHSYDEKIADQLWPTYESVASMVDQFLGRLLDTAERDGAHVIVVSDHGVVGINRHVHINIALLQAGLLALNPDRSIDLSRTRALALPLEDASVAVNLVGRKGGIIPLRERTVVLAEVRKALLAVRDPDNGEPVITQIVEPTLAGLIQPGGGSTGDLFLDFALGYYPSGSTEGEKIVTSTKPEGNHIFVPTRREMLAIFGAWGPRIEKGSVWPKVRAIDVTPTVLDILELKKPNELPGKSLLPAVQLVRPSVRNW